MTDTVMLIAGMSAILTVEVTVPEMDAGVLMGGIRVTADGQSVDTAIQIDLPSEAALSVVAGDLTITGQGISIPVINPSAAIARNVSATYEIRDEQRSIILEGDVLLPEMAPMTEYYILHPAETQTWDNGPYTLNIQINTDGRETDFVQTFTVGEANRIEFVVPQEAKPAGTATERKEKEAVPTAESQQETALPAATADEQEDGLVAASADMQTPERTLAGSDDGPSHGLVSCVVFGIPAIFVGILLWLGAINRKRGKHERPPWWQTRKHGRPSWYQGGKHSPAAGIG
jgi:hypothetical protein